MSNKKEIISIQKAAEILGVCDETLRNWEKEGKIKPFYTNGKHRRYYKEDIEELKKENYCELPITTVKVELYSDSFNLGEYKLVEHVMNKKLGFQLSIESDNEKYFKIINLNQLRQLRLFIDCALNDYTEAVKKIEKYQNKKINFGKQYFSICNKCKNKIYWYTTGISPIYVECDKCKEKIETLNNTKEENKKGL
jgi:excisionase family DNA binding protein